MKGNIGLILKQTATISSTSSYDFVFGGFFSSTLSFTKNPNGKLLKYYNPQTSVFEYTNQIINNNSPVFPTTLDLVPGTYTILTYIPNPLEILAKSSSFRDSWFDNENWLTVSKFKNLEYWGDSGVPHFTFTNINFDVFPRLKTLQFIESGTVVGTVITLNNNTLLENLTLQTNSNRDYILPDFQTINLKTLDIQGRTTQFVTNPNPVLNFSNKTSLNSINITGSSRIGGINITGCTNLVTFSAKDVANVNSTNYPGLSSCINLQKIEFGGTPSCIYPSFDISLYTNLTYLDISGANLSSITLPVILPNTCSYINVGSNNMTSGWVNLIRTNRPTGLSFLASFSKAQRGVNIVNFQDIFSNHTLTTATVDISNSEYTVSEINKILVDLDNKWVSGGTIKSLNNNTANSFSGGFNGEAAILSLISKGVSFPNATNYPSAKFFKITTTIPNQIVEFSKVVPNVNSENSIDWGDGVKETYTSSYPTALKTHTYVTPGNYTIKTSVGADTLSNTFITLKEIELNVNSGALAFSGCPALTKFTLSNNIGQTTINSRNLATNSWTNNPLFTTFIVGANVKLNFVSNATQSLSTLDLSGNALTATSIQTILQSINSFVTGSLPNIGYIKLEGGTNTPKSSWTTGANNAYTALTNKNFIITYN